MPLATVGYIAGNCTWYVASRFPTMSAHLGDALTWLANAKKAGYPTLSKPVPGSVVVYGPGHGYSVLGHVAVVDSVNADGSFQVSEMNYKGYNIVDSRRSTMTGVLGFFIPPGSPALTASGQLYGAVKPVVTSSGCVMGGPSILGTTVCMDGVVGVLAIGAGALLMLSGVAIFVAFALRGSIAQKASSTLAIAGGPFGKVVALAASSKPKPKPNAEPVDTASEKEASTARVARAKARLSPAAEEAVSEARAGRGTKLSPAVREELQQQNKREAA